MNVVDILNLPKLRKLSEVELSYLYTFKFDGNSYPTARKPAGNMVTGDYLNYSVLVPRVSSHKRLFFNVTVNPTACLYLGTTTGVPNADGCSRIPQMILKNASGTLSVGMSILGHNTLITTEHVAQRAHGFSGRGSTASDFVPVVYKAEARAVATTGINCIMLSSKGFGLDGASLTLEVEKHDTVKRVVVSCNFHACLPEMVPAWYEEL